MGPGPISHLSVVLDGSAASAAAVRFARGFTAAGVTLSFCRFADGTFAGAVEDGAEAHATHVDPAEIIACARDHGSDAILIGAHIEDGIARSVGSRTTSIMHVADRPVIVVHEDDVPRDGPVAVALSTPEHTPSVLDGALSLAATLGRPIVLLNDIDLPPDAHYYEVEAFTAKRVLEVADRLRGAGAATSVAVGDGVGPVAETLLALAERHGSSTIVAGVHDRPGIVRLFAGSVAEEIVRDARVPVMVVHHTGVAGSAAADK